MTEVMSPSRGIQQATVPEIRVSTTDPETLAQIKAAVIARCASYGINPADISDIGENRSDGITLKLNYAEGMSLFDGDALLDKKLGLFRSEHTIAGLKRLNENNAASGVSVSREPSLDDEFSALVKKGEAQIKGATINEPMPASLDDVFTTHQVTVVGEKTHAQEAARLSIALKLPELAAQYGALVMEGMYANRQPLIEQYLHSPPGTPVPPLLMLSLKHSGGGNGMPGYYSSDKLLSDAKEAGVPVYAFDTDAALLLNYSNRGSPPYGRSSEFSRKNPLDYRLVTGNEEARELIGEILKTHPKIIADVGGAHALPEDGVPGVGDYFGGSQVIIADGTIPQNEIIRNEVIRDKQYDLMWRHGDYLQITSNPTELKQKLAALKASTQPEHTDPFHLPSPIVPGNGISSREQGH